MRELNAYEEIEDDVLVVEVNATPHLLEGIGTVDDSTSLHGAPWGWLSPCPPKDYKAPDMKLAKGELLFDEIDNQGKWSQFTFHPVFDKKGGQYLYHMMPSGAAPIPVNPKTNK